MRPDKQVVERLELWLDLAKRGELREVVLVGRFLHDGYETAYALHDLETMVIEMRAAAYQMEKENDPSTQATSVH